LAFLLGFALFALSIAVAQTITREKLRDSVHPPYFSIHKDNYFVTGMPINIEVNGNNADAKYQINSILP